MQLLAFFAGLSYILAADMADAGLFVRCLLQARVLTQDTHRNTRRLAPPLIINESRWAVDRLAEGGLHHLFRRRTKRKPWGQSKMQRSGNRLSEKIMLKQKDDAMEKIGVRL
jgi:hypothetical protein